VCNGPQICLSTRGRAGASDAFGGRSASGGRQSAPQCVLWHGVAIVADEGRSAAVMTGDGSRSVTQDRSGMSHNGGVCAADFGVHGLSVRHGMRW
jgi:hypothetical protein